MRGLIENAERQAALTDESFKNKKYDDVIKRSIIDFMDSIIKSAQTAKQQVDDPALVTYNIADIVMRCTVAMAFMYQVTNKSSKLKAVTARLDKLPGAIRDAVRVKGFGPVK
jgi:hypothetical protein